MAGLGLDKTCPKSDVRAETGRMYKSEPCHVLRGEHAGQGWGGLSQTKALQRGKNELGRFREEQGALACSQVSKGWGAEEVESDRAVVQAIRRNGNVILSALTLRGHWEVLTARVA